MSETKVCQMCQDRAKDFEKMSEIASAKEAKIMIKMMDISAENDKLRASLAALQNRFNDLKEEHEFETAALKVT